LTAGATDRGETGLNAGATDRREEIWLSVKDECVGALAAGALAFFENRDAFAEAADGFLRHFAELFRILAAAQNAGEKGPLRHITISFPESAVIAETYKLVTACHGGDPYTDETETETYRRADFLEETISRGTEGIVPALRKKILRIRDYEIEEFRIRYACAHTALLLSFFERVLPRVFELPEFSDVPKESAADVLFGGYTEEGLTLIVCGEEGAQ
jgi:hypothetical protein